MPVSNLRLKPLPGSVFRVARHLGLSALFVLIAVDSVYTPALADGEVRTLRIHHTHTKETISVVYKRNGRYDEAGLAKLNHILRDWRNHAQTKMDPRLFDAVWEVYQEVGASEPIQIISAYRSPATNAMLRRRSRGVARNSQHMLGKAMDFNIPGVPLENLRHAGLRAQRGGVGFYPGSNFVHLDIGSVRHWPRMAPDQLARVMSQGRGVFARRNTPTRTVTASAAPTQVAQVAQADTQPERNFFMRMFGIGDAARQEPASGATRPAAAEPRGTQMAGIPAPRAAPREAPAQTAHLKPSEVVQARGYWNASDMLAGESASARPAKPVLAAARENPGNVRYVWQVGPQPVTTGDSTVASKRTPAPRSRPDGQVARADVTGSVPWPLTDRPDRVPADLVLAYAAAPGAELSLPPAPQRSPAATGVTRPAAPARSRSAAPPQPSSSPEFARLGGNPWLRAVTLTPSVLHAMDVAAMGQPNYRQLNVFMHKPSASVANGFAAEADFGLATTRFAGPAVVAVPTVRFRTTTAAL